MNKKIFEKLKQVYSHLGLGDEILMAQSENLAKLGFVTDDNLETVVNAQKDFLEGLQRANDRRASEALAKGRDSARKEFEEAAKKKEEDAKKAAEEAARKKAEEDAKAAEEAKKAAEEAERKKAEEKAEKERLAELEKNKVPEWFLKEQKEQAERAKKEREDAEAKAKDAEARAKKEHEEFMNTLKQLQEQNKTLNDTITALKKENDDAKVAKAKAQRENFIFTKAKEMGIPQSRIDEGFAIKDEMDESGISEYLGKVAANYKAMQLPQNTKQQMDASGKVDKAEMDALAASMVK